MLFTKFDLSVIFSSCSNYGTAVQCTCKKEWTLDKANIWELHISTPHEFLTAANSWCGPTNESIVQKWINEIQSTPDNSNLEGKSKKKVWVIGSSKQIAGSKGKTSFYCTVNILTTLNCRKLMLSENWKKLLDCESECNVKNVA